MSGLYHDGEVFRLTSSLHQCFNALEELEKHKPTIKALMEEVNDLEPSTGTNLDAANPKAIPTNPTETQLDEIMEWVEDRKRGIQEQEARKKKITTIAKGLTRFVDFLADTSKKLSQSTVQDNRNGVSHHGHDENALVGEDFTLEDSKPPSDQELTQQEVLGEDKDTPPAEGNKRTSLTFDEVYQDGNADPKHEIVEHPKNSRRFYIIRCTLGTCDRGFGPSPLHAARSHVKQIHFPRVNFSATDPNVVRMVGVRVTLCNAEKVGKNNEAFNAWHNRSKQAEARSGKPQKRRRSPSPALAANSMYSTREISPNAEFFEKYQASASNDASIARKNKRVKLVDVSKIKAGEVYCYEKKGVMSGAAVVVPLFEDWSSHRADVLGTADQEGFFERENIKWSPVPECIDYDADTETVRGWKVGYRDGEPKVCERSYPVVNFLGPDYHNDTSRGWMAVKDFREYDDTVVDGNDVKGVNRFQMQMKNAVHKEKAAKGNPTRASSIEPPQQSIEEPHPENSDAPQLDASQKDLPEASRSSQLDSWESTLSELSTPAPLEQPTPREASQQGNHETSGLSQDESSTHPKPSASETPKQHTPREPSPQQARHDPTYQARHEMLQRRSCSQPESPRDTSSKSSIQESPEHQTQREYAKLRNSKRIDGDASTRNQLGELATDALTHPSNDNFPRPSPNTAGHAFSPRASSSVLSNEVNPGAHQHTPQARCSFARMDSTPCLADPASSEGEEDESIPATTPDMARSTSRAPSVRSPQSVSLRRRLAREHASGIDRASFPVGGSSGPHGSGSRWSSPAPAATRVDKEKPASRTFRSILDRG